MKLLGDDVATVESGDGSADGHQVGGALGREKSISREGAKEGDALAIVGLFDGNVEGSRVGCRVGTLLGNAEGRIVGVLVLGSSGHGPPVPKPQAVDG